MDTKKRNYSRKCYFCPIRLAIDIALPSVIFAGIVTNFDIQETPGWWQLPLWWVLFSIVALAVTFISTFLSRTAFQSEFALSLFFQNGLFFPIIIITGIFGAGSSYIVQLFIFIIFHPVVFFSTYHLFFRRSKAASKKRALNLQRIINPVLIGTLLAMAIILLGIKDYIPSFLVNMLDMVGGMTLPLIMLILGGSLFIDFQKKGRIYAWEVTRFIIIKNFVFPLIFIALLILIRPDYYIALIIFLQSAVPPITGVPIQVSREDGNVSLANQFILGSFFASTVSIPLMFLLFNKYFPMP